MRPVFILLIFLFIYGCKEKPLIIDDLSDLHGIFVAQNKKEIVFPDFVKGKLIVMNYIFTNCPDICPLSTNNMRLIQERLKKEKIESVQFVSLSFDPENDTPEVLSKFAEIRNLDLSNWNFLTGKKAAVDSLMNRIGVMAVKNDSTILKNGRKIFYFVHTDRIQLIDVEGKIKKKYKGSTINVDEIIADIKNLQ